MTTTTRRCLWPHQTENWYQVKGLPSILPIASRPSSTAVTTPWAPFVRSCYNQPHQPLPSIRNLVKPARRRNLVTKSEHLRNPPNRWAQLACSGPQHNSTNGCLPKRISTWITCLRGRMCCLDFNSPRLAKRGGSSTTYSCKTRPSTT